MYVLFFLLIIELMKWNHCPHVVLIVCFFFLCCVFFDRWRMSGMQNYNPEQIVLSAVAHRSSRDVNIMKEKLIFSGAALDYINKQ